MYDKLYVDDDLITIYSYIGSTAHTYAKMNELKFVSLDESPSTTNPDVTASKYGDSNCDGQVNLADAVLIMQNKANPAKYIITEEGVQMRTYIIQAMELQIQMHCQFRSICLVRLLNYPKELKAHLNSIAKPPSSSEPISTEESMVLSL